MVRWTRKRFDEPGNGRGYLLRAVVENHLFNSGAEHHDVSIQLGVVEERYLTANIPSLREFHRGLFWVSVDKNLDRLKLSSIKRKKIEQKVSQKVPRPSAEWALWGVICVPEFDP